ncbi:hypothetical protein CL3_34500 [butyrate-producing bacterium SM4/1]|nr:hypothetical protein CL3_34500 [butyrate-producing bacterium SM4/1]
MTEAVKHTREGNPLGYERLPRLLKSYAVPSVIAMLVSSLYNIVDQILSDRVSAIWEMQPPMWPIP